jgi:hypothetical protein
MPRYETDNDRKTQAEIAAVVEDCWQCRLFKMREYEVVDYAMLHRVDFTITAWVEIKGRKMRVAQYPTIMMSLHKWERGVFRALITRLPFHFIVGCLEDGQIIYHTFDRNLKLRVEWSGRTNRGMDNEDVEPVVHIPISEFNPLQRKDQQELL